MKTKPKKVSKAQLAVIDLLQAGISWLWTDKAHAYVATMQDGIVTSRFLNGRTFRGLKQAGVIALDKKSGRWNLALPRG